MDDLLALRDMTVFVEVARTGSFSRASANLGVPGATLSRRIAEMERNFGAGGWGSGLSCLLSASLPDCYRPSD